MREIFDRWNRVRSVGGASMAIVVVGCTAVGPDHQPPQASAPKAWNQGGDVRIARAQGDIALKRWWDEFEEPTLSMLVGIAVDANFDVRTAESQLRQARAERRRSRSSFLPTLDARGGSGQSGQFLRDNADGASRLHSAGFDATWELDVFGGARRAAEAGDADEAAAEESLRDVLVSVVAEIALNFADLRTLEHRRSIAEANLAAQAESGDIIAAQVEAGAVTTFDLDRARANVEETRASIPAIDQEIVAVRNRLCTLVGRSPGALEDVLGSTSGIPDVPIEVAIGIPADVLRRRPDVRAAERRLAAETARVGVATAELYPKFVLNGSIGIESTSMAGLSGIYDFGPQIRWALFRGGSIRREIEIQSEVQEQALIAYEARVAEALAEVETSLSAFGEEQARLVSLRLSSEAAARAAEVATARYQAGLTGYIDVLDAQRSRLSAEDAVARSEGKLVSDLVRLYKALGGGWQSLAEEKGGV